MMLRETLGATAEIAVMPVFMLIFSR